MPVIDLANPSRVLVIVNRLLPWLVAVTIILLAIGLFRALNAFVDYEQGATEKMFSTPEDPRTFAYVNGRFG